MTVKQLKTVLEGISDESVKVAIKVKDEDRAIAAEHIAVYDCTPSPYSDQELLLSFAGCEGEFCDDVVLVIG